MDKTYIVLNSLNLYSSRDKKFYIFYLNDIPVDEKISLGDFVTVQHDNVKSVMKCCSIEVGSISLNLAKQGKGVFIGTFL